MFALTNKPDMGARLYSGLIRMATDPSRGTDGMKLIQHIAGVLVETYLVFDEPDKAMEASLQELSGMMGCRPAAGALGQGVLPPANIIDLETEKGRAAARAFFEEWLDCAFEFHKLMLVIVHNILISWEAEGLPRAESLRLLIECVHKAMGFELAAQELCDVVIDRKVASEGWGLGDCIASLSAVAGRRLALSLNTDACMIFRGCNLPDNLDHVVFVMTQEAVRLGVPAGTDWRFGLAANDVPVNAPLDLIFGIEPYCQSFFNAINMNCQYDQSVSCAKAAGRMLAVAAGGEVPEMEPAIAKPLAMAAMTETYKSVCMEHEIVSL
ncbi:MAG: hypothetical protein H6860_04420 [Rhodospirillales bacterium]|nr:hypothetical protein [Alphaproteobacteria bacterium]MCB9981625.1 hypothetical protein [Rhodospirillales bacterium]